MVSFYLALIDQISIVDLILCILSWLFVSVFTIFMKLFLGIYLWCVFSINTSIGIMSSYKNTNIGFNVVFKPSI